MESPPHARSSLTRRALARLRGERGAVMVEFIVVLPVLLLIVLGIIDFGRFYNYSDQESQLAAQAARWAAVAYDPPGSQTLQAYVAGQASAGLQTTGGDVTSAARVYIYYPGCSSNCNTAGNPIRACVTAQVKLLPYLGGGSMTITQTATMRIEQTLPSSGAPWSVDSSVPSSCPQS